MNFSVIINTLASGLNLAAYSQTGGTLNLFFFFLCGILAVTSYRSK